MIQRKQNWRSFAMLLSVCGAVALPAKAPADQTIRTGDGLLQIQANMPDQTRVGEQFTYTIKVTNSSDNFALHDVELRQRKADGFTIESTSIQSQGQRSDTNAKSKQATEEKNQSRQGQFKIPMLGPGESRLIEVKAAADNEGELRSCLEIVNYKPAVCITSKVVKPELEITKLAPEKADRCSVIELEYTVKNGGSGDVGKFQVVDELGDGLATIDGNSTLKFDVDGLRAGDTRKFIARVFASKPGEFSSRAVAKATNSELKARSKQTATKVVAADLAVRLDGPGRLYGDQLAKFTAHVTNVGNTDATDVRVRVMWPEDSRLVDLGTPAMQTAQKSKSSKQANEKNQDSPKLAAKEKNSASKDSAEQSDKQKEKAANKKDDQQKQQEKIAMQEREFTIDRVQAGQTAKFEYAIRAGDIDELPTKVEARYVCTVDLAQDQEKAKNVAISTANVKAKLVRLPALQLVVVDDEDPVSNGDEVTYMIRVWNEGDAQDHEVQLTAELPDGLKFSSADGPTEHSVEGSTITFKPLESIEPGDRADFRIVAKSTGEGNATFEAILTSKSLDGEVVTEEPTRLFSRQARN